MRGDGLNWERMRSPATTCRSYSLFGHTPWICRSGRQASKTCRVIGSYTTKKRVGRLKNKSVPIFSDQQLVIDALRMALEQRQPEPGLIHHSDQGQVYAGTAYRAMLHAHGIVQSMSRKGNCLDNAVAESFFSNLKNELVHHTLYEDRDQARAAIFDYMELFYNRQRLHESLGYISLANFEAMASVA